ncbi:hypothetical protein D910_01847 [Dendroctonus ponderosae]|uniref:Protein tweety homolog n=1 Tax=Dendroctonus ponderosae TaxID=77166 RepID=U4TSE1_DENPD|nr:hypothetical protein D910_01847 [Dendroctonus ponderosae]
MRRPIPLRNPGNSKDLWNGGLPSLGILASVPAAWLIFTLFILLLYLLTRCCDRKPRPAKSISALKITLAVMSVLCCGVVGLGLYGNDDLHNGVVQALNQARQIDGLVQKIRNQTEAIERQLRVQAKADFAVIRTIFDVPPVSNISALKEVEGHFKRLMDNNTQAANAASDIRTPLMALDIIPKIETGEKLETIRWPFTMTILSILLILCVILVVGVARHNRCALIAFSVCGLLAVIASFLLSSVYLASTVALADFCMAPEKFIENQASADLSREILRHYLNCERARANPFTQRLREAKTTLENMRIELSLIKPKAVKLFPNKGLEQKFSSLKNEINTADTIGTQLTALVDCRTLYTHYLRGTRALCNLGLLGLTYMLISAVLAGLLMTVLVWVDSHTWIYIRKKKDYQQVNEADPYLPPPAATQAIAARTLQRSQGQFPGAPPDTPPPSYAHAALLRPPPMHVAASAPVHEADLLLDGCDTRAQEHHRGAAQMAHLRGHTLGRLPSHHHHHESVSGPNNGKYATLSKQHACKDFPNFKGFTFDQQHQPQQGGNAQQPKNQQQQVQGHELQRTATLGKYSSLGRRPLPQIPDEKARSKPPMPKVPITISGTISETPLNPNSFRSLQRGAWQDSVSSFQPAAQFRSLQRNNGAQIGSGHAQFRSVKIQDQQQAPGDDLYANSENERQLYAVTEL